MVATVVPAPCVVVIACTVGDADDGFCPWILEVWTDEYLSGCKDTLELDDIADIVVIWVSPLADAFIVECDLDWLLELELSLEDWRVVLS